MKKAKKLGLQSLALVLMAFVLVAGVAFGMTGAWFTDGHKAEQTLTFGQIGLSVTNASVKNFRHDAERTESQPKNTANSEAVLMPGDDIVIQLSVNKTEASADLYCMIFISVDGLESTDETAIGDFSDETARTITGTAQTLTKVFTLNGDDYGNDYETENITITYEVRAIQVANLTATEAATILTTKASDFVYTGTGTYTFTKTGHGLDLKA